MEAQRRAEEQRLRDEVADQKKQLADLLARSRRAGQVKAPGVGIAGAQHPLPSGSKRRRGPDLSWQKHAPAKQSPWEFSLYVVAVRATVWVGSVLLALRWLAGMCQRSRN